MESSSMDTSSTAFLDMDKNARDYQPTTTKDKCSPRRVMGAFGIFGLLAMAVVHHQFSSTQTEQSSLASVDKLHATDMTQMAAKATRRRKVTRRRKAKTSSKKKDTAKTVASGPSCEEQCSTQGYTCNACSITSAEVRGADQSSITNCASTYGKPSCAMGCHIGSLSTSVDDCNSQCDQATGCNWAFRGTSINLCGPPTSCPGEDRSKASVDQCKTGCKQMFDGTHDNGPQMTDKEVLAKVNEIRAANGIGPMTYNSDGDACADKAAAYNAIHGPHKCGIDGVCDCGFRAAGDFNANDKVDAIERAYETRFHEGPADGTCDEQSHCGALLIYDRIAVGCDEANAYYTVYYYDK